MGTPARDRIEECVHQALRELGSTSDQVARRLLELRATADRDTRDPVQSYLDQRFPDYQFEVGAYNIAVKREGTLIVLCESPKAVTDFICEADVGLRPEFPGASP